MNGVVTASAAGVISARALPAPAPSSRAWAVPAGAWQHAGLLGILALNFLLRWGLEHHNHVWYFELTQRRFPLNLSVLLPVYICDDQCVWITSSLYPIDLLTRVIGTPATFYVLNALVILCSYWTSWVMTRSRVFAYTMAVCMAFGTQFHYSYVLSGTFAMYLQVCYLEIITLCGFKMLTAPCHQGRWRAGFIGMISFMAIGFDTWLNFYVFLVFATGFLYAFYRRRGEADKLATLRFALFATTAFLLVWLPVKLSTGKQHFIPGREDEVILGYRRPILAVEDFYSNLVTYTFMATTNYLPPAFVTSNSDFWHGPEKIVAEQHGYHPSHLHQVAEHHMFYWYFHAGMVFAACLYCLGKCSLQALRDGSLSSACVVVMLLGIGAGSATHVMIKYRSYMGVPALSYKCMPSILAVTYLIAYGLMHLRQSLASRRLSAALVGGCWALILYAGLTRPALLNHLHGQVGVNPMPVNPAARLVEIGKDLWYRVRPGG